MEGNGNGAGWLVWFDDDLERPLKDKVEAACVRFVQKHRCRPTVVRVHPASLDGYSNNKIKVVADPLALLHHIWVGPVPKEE